MYYTEPDGRQIGLDECRMDERQRRLRLRLSKTPTCWEYASLLDVVVREPGIDEPRFTGKTAAEWLSDLQSTDAVEYPRFRRWYESIVNASMSVLAKQVRVPDNHYCIELAKPPFVSQLSGFIRNLALKRASARQWQATLRGLTTKGLKPEELEHSGVIARLENFSDGVMLSREEVLGFIDLGHVTPRLSYESRYGFSPKAGWHEGCRPIPDKEFKRRGLLGRGHGARHVIRFWHNSMGWSVARSRYRDLVTERTDWWSVLDDKGRFVQQPDYGFDSPEAAMEFAELRMSQTWSNWGNHQALAKWERFSLPGGDGYREIFVQIDDWPETYRPRHYRTRNVLAHLRTSIRKTIDGKKVLFLDEVQSDWHADLYQESKPEGRPRRDIPTPNAPFRKEWPLLSMKLMLWWAQRLGADGVVWSTAELQDARWQGYGPPEMLYRSALPDAARSLAKALDLNFGAVRLSVRTQRWVALAESGWLVKGRKGHSVTKPFRTRAQAEHFANLTGAFVAVEVPALWIGGAAPFKSIPLYGAGTAAMWQKF